MSVPKPGDLGIILAKAGAVGAAYVDISGNTQAYTLIHGLYAAQGAALVAGRDYSRPAIGKSQKLSLFVTVTLAGATDIKLKLQSRYQEGDAWADMQTQRCDTGSTTLEQTFSADGTVLVQTINELSTGQIQLVVLAVGAIAAGTIVIVKARCTI
jgi:hypothetical protein